MENYNYKLEKELGLEPELDCKFEQVPDDWVLTPENVADLIGMSVVSVRRWCREGKLPAYRFERKYIITGKDFKEFMKKARNRSKAAKSVFQS
ncbi:helix-turn-helix domain-containing protein [Geobacillus sp. E263]|uniref:helix-turn-helix domain-containing protein n=1 Tax=Geobacillus sp. E263 TaxID=391290 RepID=UPI00117B9079|nr:helix-turn-helix domain-containing protein [Geobacillus sp. E263]